MRTGVQLAVITGGEGGLAREIAASLAMPGWTVENPGRNELDVTDENAVDDYFKPMSVDLLVCAAGITMDRPLARLDQATWDQTWAVNFNGALSCARAVLPRMLEHSRGHIIFVSSYSALHPPIGQAAYASAKAALLGLTADLALRYGAANVRVNVVLPGFMETRMTKTVTESRQREILAAHSLGRFNTCRETAAFIRFLHHEMPHTSGQVFQLDSRPAFR